MKQSFVRLYKCIRVLQFYENYCFILFGFLIITILPSARKVHQYDTLCEGNTSKLYNTAVNHTVYLYTTIFHEIPTKENIFLAAVSVSGQRHATIITENGRNSELTPQHLTPVYLGYTVYGWNLDRNLCHDQVSKHVHVHGHGRLMDPPARNSMWRFGYPNPVNYNDNELFCGGFAVQWVENNGQCGVCGDPYHFKDPRPHEAGGEYAKGTIVRHYTAGQDIDVEVELTANHLGRFEMYLCPNNNPRSEATQECFDRYPLYVTGTRDVGFEIPIDTEKKAIFQYRVTLPSYVTCSQCVIQWNYYTGNMWGTCDNGTEASGCGKPETFRNCADVSIVTSTAGVPPLFVQQDNPFLLYYKDYRSPNNIFPLVVRSQVCVPSPLYRRIPGMGNWCQSNCLRYPPNCPVDICQCPEVCDAIGEIAGKEGASVYCMDQCLVYPSNCPYHRCRCY